MNAHLLGDAAARVRQHDVVLQGPEAVALAELLDEIEWQGSRLDDEPAMREVVEAARQLAEKIMG